MAEIAIHPYTKWQKSRPIPIPELKNCDPSEQHLRTRHFLGVNPPGPKQAINSGASWIKLQLHRAIYRPDSFVLMLRYSANLKAIRSESTSLKRIVADKSRV